MNSQSNFTILPGLQIDKRLIISAGSDVNSYVEYQIMLLYP